MKSGMDHRRIKTLIDFLKSLNIKSERFENSISETNHTMLSLVNESLTHSSAHKNTNHEKLEFFGDAVLRLAASEFIDQNYSEIEVGKRSELRAQIVSDEWLTKLGKNINLEQIIIAGPKALGDDYSRDTIIAETAEALIGAIYKNFESILEINLWLDKYWTIDAKLILEAPHLYNAKSSLQEWCQEKKIDLPQYEIKEVSKVHGDPNRFFCKLFILGKLVSSSFGKSHKKAEKNAAYLALEKVIKENDQLIRLTLNHSEKK